MSKPVGPKLQGYKSSNSARLKARTRNSSINSASKNRAYASHHM